MSDLTTLVGVDTDGFPYLAELDPGQQHVNVVGRIQLPKSGAQFANGPVGVVAVFDAANPASVYAWLSANTRVVDRQGPSLLAMPPSPLDIEH